MLLLCDGEGCNSSYHAWCLDPPLLDVPEGDWRRHGLEAWLSCCPWPATALSHPACSIAAKAGRNLRQPCSIPSGIEQQRHCRAGSVALSSCRMRMGTGQLAPRSRQRMIAEAWGTAPSQPHRRRLALHAVGAYRGLVGRVDR